MRFPAPDVGVARFPGPDIRAARFPGIDEATVPFPPAPKLVVRVSTETVIDIISTGVVIGVPWHLAETVIDVISTTTVSASVTVDTASVVDVVSETVQIIDVVNSETIVDIVSGTTVKPSPTVSTNTVVDIASTSSVKPSPTITTETVIDIASTAVIVPSPTSAGETIVDIASTSTVKPSPTVNTNTVVDILSEGVISNFKPFGMVKSGTFSTTSTVPVLITGMVANASLTGSTVTSDALVSNFGGPVRIGFSIELTSSGGQSSTVGVYKNGALVGTAVVDTVAYNGVTVMFGSVTTTVAVGDAITLRYNQASTAWSTTVAATVTRLNISAGDSVAIGGTTSADYTPASGWTDVVFTPTAGTTMSGNAFVVPMAHPNAILTTVLPVRSDQAMAARILVNGSVVVTGPNTPAYDLRVRATAGVAVAAGDLVTVQVQRLSTFGTTVYAGAKFAIV